MKAKTTWSVTLLLLLCNAYATAQQEAVSRLTRYEVKQEYRTPFQKVLGDYVSYSLSDPDNIMSEAYYEQDKPAVLWVIERWTGNNALDKFSNSAPSEAVRLLAAKALVKPVKHIYVKDLEPLSKQQWRRTATIKDSQLTIMLFVDAKAGTQQTFREVYHTAMPQFRSEPGVVTYQLSQLEENDTQFVTYEKFRGTAAFQYHLNFPPIQPVIDYLNTSIKKQPFQDGLHTLIEFAPLTREQ